MPRPVMRAFSRRRAEIDAALAERGTSGARAAEAAALATRRVKDPRVDGRACSSTSGGARAEELGFGARGAAARRRAASGARASARRDWARSRERLAGPNGLTRRSATFGRGEVLQALCEALPRGAHVDARTLEARGRALPRDARRAADAGRRGARDRRGVPAARRAADAGGRRSAALLDARAPGAGAAARRARRCARAAPASGVGERDGRRGVRRGAADAVGRAAARRRVAVPRRPWRGGRRRPGRDGQDVHARCGARGVAGGRATRCSASRSRDVPLASCGRAPGSRARASRRCSAICARASGCPSGACSSSTRPGWCRRGELAELLDHVERASGKLVLVGDDRQLPSIEAGGAFRGLIQRGLAVELGENVRQANVWEREALDHLRAGRAEEALGLYGEHGALVVEPTARRRPRAARARLARRARRRRQRDDRPASGRRRRSQRARARAAAGGGRARSARSSSWPAVRSRSAIRSS